MRVGIMGDLDRSARDLEAVVGARELEPEPSTEPSPTPASKRSLSLGPLEVDLVAHRVTVKGNRVRLTAMQLRLLAYLIEHRDEVVRRADLLTQVWGYQGEVQTRTVDIHVQRLRERLGFAAALVTTVRGIGYRLSEDPD